MDLSKDIRYQILNELNQMGHTTEEIRFNDFLATLVTINGKGDIGTIKRALAELDEAGYINESDYPGRSSYKDINTKGGRDTAKNPKRFVDDIIDDQGSILANQLSNYYFFITLKGKKFLWDWENENEEKLSRELQMTVSELSRDKLLSDELIKEKENTIRDLQQSIMSKQTKPFHKQDSFILWVVTTIIAIIGLFT